MPGYTKTNLMDVEDAAVGFGLSPDMESRFARDALEGGATGLSYQRLAPGVRQPFGHRHSHQEEIYVILSGSGRVKLEDEVVELASWDAIRVAPETMRSFEAGSEGMELLAFGAHKDSKDVETVPGWWSD